MKSADTRADSSHPAIPPDAIAGIMPLVYEELRRLASAFRMNERPNHTLQTTALVHEAYIRLADSSNVGSLSRSEFVSAAVGAVRRVLIDYARAHRCLKRGGAVHREARPLDELPDDGPDLDLIAMDEALRELATIDARKASVVELRFFGGLSEPETAEQLGVSLRTVQSDWRLARAWLHQRIVGPEERIP